ncbi:MAG: nuclear transport factor 2 family protein, partial [Chloroflexota bacterium]|nr:nuclear transport factor 2 family protein [Chloroflexota bacterium]
APTKAGRGSQVSPTCTTARTAIGVCGDRGVSEWLLTGTTTAGVRVRVRRCDLWEFRNGQVSRKDSYWKIVEP